MVRKAIGVYSTMEKTIVVYPRIADYTFKYINCENALITNLYKNPDSNIIIKILRKIFYFISLGRISLFYGSWTKYLDNPNAKLVFFDSCKPYHRLYRFLKRSKARIYIYFWNPIELRKKEIDKLKSAFIVATYSRSDSQKYDIGFNGQFLPKIPLPASHDSKYTGIFCGYVKNRGNLINKIYKSIDNSFFYVVADKQDFDFPVVDRPMDYYEYLKKVIKSSAVIEVLPTENAGMTLRTVESIFYGKKLITNNKKIVEEDFYNRNNILVFSDDTTKDDVENFLKLNFIPYDQTIVDQFSFESWLDRFEDL